MRWLLLVLSVSLLSQGAPAQSPPGGLQARVASVIQTGGTDGSTDKELGRAGDAAAVEVTRAVAGKTLTAHEMDDILAVLHLAFAAPTRLVENPPDRTPRTALFVLQYLASVATDPGVKARVAKERQYMESIARAAQTQN